jgi:hypothetical protein
MNGDFVSNFQRPGIGPKHQLDATIIYNQDILEESIVNQYENLENLGEDLLESNDVRDVSLIRLIGYVEENYLPISNIDTILESPQQTQILGRFLYKLICVDLLNIILPNTMKMLGLSDPSELCILSLDSLREHLLRVTKIKLEALRTINVIPNNTVYGELLKYVSYVDFLDNDIESLLENFIIPVTDKYYVEIHSRTLAI